MAASINSLHEYTRRRAAAGIIAIFLPQCFGGLSDWPVSMQSWEKLCGPETGGIEMDMPTQNNSKGRLMAADFFTHTLKAFLIGVATSVVLAGAVILLAQSTAQEEAALGNDTPAIEEAK